jgi:hypothetical protein
MTTSMKRETEELPADWVELGYIRITKCLTGDGVSFWLYTSPELNRAERIGMIDLLQDDLDGY